MNPLPPPRRSWLLPALVLLLSLPGLGGSAVPARADPGLCEQAARVAAAETGVPLDLLRAIALAESGRRQAGVLRPWPWAINRGGPGFWFADQATAVAAVTTTPGSRNIDIGCFQLNLHWHGAGFPSVEQMFDPLANARYAARFLRDLHRETGDWLLAAGAYHSRTPALAERYRNRVAALMGNLPAAAPALLPIAPGPELPRANNYPLFLAGTPGGAGSLVPQIGAGRSLLAAAAGRLIGG